MTKGDKMVWSYLHWKRRQLQFDRKHCIKVTHGGLTLSFRKPCSDPVKIAEAAEYLKNVVETLSSEAHRHMVEVLTTGYSEIQV